MFISTHVCVNDYLYLKLIVLHHVVNRFESLNLIAVNHTKGVKKIELKSN